LGLPFTLKQIADQFDNMDRKEFKSKCKAIERLVERFVKIGFFKDCLRAKNENGVIFY
jgi:hypothetical protein